MFHFDHTLSQQPMHMYVIIQLICYRCIRHHTFVNTLPEVLGFSRGNRCYWRWGELGSRCMRSPAIIAHWLFPAPPVQTSSVSLSAITVRIWNLPRHPREKRSISRWNHCCILGMFATRFGGNWCLNMPHTWWRTAIALHLLLRQSDRNFRFYLRD